MGNQRVRGLWPSGLNQLVGLLVFTVAIILGLNVPQAGNAAQATERAVYYVALGDSLAQGLGASKVKGTLNGYVNRYYHQLLKLDPSLELVNLGLHDMTSSQLLGKLMGDSRYQQSIAQAKVITINIGANDFLALLGQFEERPTAEPQLVIETYVKLMENLKAIITAVKLYNPQAEIYVMNYYNPFPDYKITLPTAIGAFTWKLDDFVVRGNQDLMKAMKQAGVPVADVATPFRQNLSQFINAGQDPFAKKWPMVHPNDSGYMAIAQAFWESTKYHRVLSGGPKELRDIANHPAEREIAYLVAKGIIKGKSNGRFTPETPLTRAEFIAMVVRALLEEAGTGSGSSNSGNLPELPNHWVAREVGKAVYFDLIPEVGASYNLDAPIPRQECAQILTRAALYNGSNVHEKYIFDLLSSFNGALNEGLSRAQGAELICKYLEKMPGVLR